MRAVHLDNKLSPAQCNGLLKLKIPEWCLMQKVADLSRRSVGLVCGPAVLEVSACWGTRVKGGVESRTKVAFSHRSSHDVDRRKDSRLWIKLLKGVLSSH